MTTQRYQEPILGDFWLDESRGTLTHGDRIVSSRRQVVQLLAYLSKRPNQLVSREELTQALWPNDHGSPGALNFCIAKAREVLEKLPNHRLRTSRGHGYCLEVALPLPRSAEHSGSRASSNESYPTPPARASQINAIKPTTNALLERDEELASLLEQWGQVERWRQPRLVVVRAQAGLGKTSLAQELTRQLTNAGKRCVWGSCVEGESPPGFWPWPEVVERLATRTTTDEEVSKAADALSAADRYRYFRQVRRALWNGTQSGGLAVVLDNMHLADVDAFSLLNHLFGREQRLSVLVILLVRDPVSETLDRSLASLLSHAVELRLRPLTDNGAKALLRNNCPALVADLEQRVLKVVDGNPLFLRKVIQELRSSSHRFGETDSSGPVAASIGQVFTLQLALLPQDTRTLLVAAAFFGEEFHLVHLAAVVSIDVEDVYSRLQPAVEVGMVIPNGLHRFRFEHNLLRIHLNESTSGAWRTAQHWKTGQALLNAPLADRTLRSSIAFHLTRGAQTREQATEALLACETAADANLRACSFESALAQYTDALALSEHARLSARDCARLLVSQSRAARLTGKLYEAREAAKRAIEIAEDAGLAEGLTGATIALSETWSNLSVGTPELSRLLKRALNNASNSSQVDECRLVCCLSRAAYPFSSGGESSILSHVQRLGHGLPASGASRGYLLLAEGYTCFGSPAQDARLRTLLEQALEIFSASGHLAEEAQVLTLSRGLAIRRGDAILARNLQRQLTCWENAAPFDRMTYVALSTDAALAVFRNDTDARQRIEHAYHLGMKTAPETAAEVSAGQLLLHAIECSPASELEGVLRRIPGTAQGSPLGQLALAFVLALMGRNGESRQHYEEVVRLLPQDLSTNVELGFVTMLCELIAHHGDRERATEALETYTPCAGWLGITGSVGLIVGSVGYSLGVMAAIVGRTDQARMFFGCGRQTAQHFSAQRWSARCERAIARLEPGPPPSPWVLERQLG